MVGHPARPTHEKREGWSTKRVRTVRGKELERPGEKYHWSSAIFLRSEFIEEARWWGRVWGGSIEFIGVRIVDKIYEAGGYGLSGACTSGK